MNYIDLYLSFASIFHIGVSMKQGIISFLLTSRSLLCTWNHYYENPIYHNYIYCLGTMFLKDVLEILPRQNMKILGAMMLCNFLC